MLVWHIDPAFVRLVPVPPRVPPEQIVASKQALDIGMVSIVW